MTHHNMTSMKLHILSSIITTAAILFTLSSCSDSESYADLLNDENQLVNAFLAEHRVIETIPENNDFEVGEDAPYYRIDDEGNVYMQVLSKGTGEMPEEGDRVYFRYIRYDLNYYVVGSDYNSGAGNMNSPGNTEATYFLFDDYTTDQSSQYGTGIQLPVKLLGYSCKVNVVIKSQSGPSADMSYVVPYLYNISYYKMAL